jgi:hypothetical protein
MMSDFMDSPLKLAYLLGIVGLVVLLPLAGFRSALGLGRFLLACVATVSLIAVTLFAVKLAVAGMEGRPVDGTREYWINAGLSALLTLQFAVLGRIAGLIFVREIPVMGWTSLQVLVAFAMGYLFCFLVVMNVYI